MVEFIWSRAEGEDYTFNKPISERFRPSYSIVSCMQRREIVVHYET